MAAEAPSTQADGRLRSFEDDEELQEFFHIHRLTDGLPIVAPTLARVDAMLAAGTRAGDETIGVIAGRSRGITVEQAAVCAVMAGALPEYFPVILATWDAILDPAMDANATFGSSGSTAITAIVSGAYAAEIGMNAEHNMLGPGNRANATMGRAVRLGLRNALGYRTGELDGAAFGNQARYTAHFAERTPPPEWEPLRVRLGHGADTTTVTAAMTDAPRQLSHNLDGDPHNVLRMFATCMRDLSHVAAGRSSSYFLVIGPEHTEILVSGGLVPADISEWVAGATRVTREEIEAAGIPLSAGRHDVLGDDGKLATTAAEDVHVVTAGGTGAGWSQVIFGYAPSRVFRPVTREVEVP
jgi:hypothetical protein